jgi:hypothetical protein
MGRQIVKIVRKFGSYNSLGVAPGAIPREDILVRAAGEPKFWLVACSDT